MLTCLSWPLGESGRPVALCAELIFRVLAWAKYLYARPRRKCVQICIHCLLPVCARSASGKKGPRPRRNRQSDNQTGNSKYSREAGLRQETYAQKPWQERGTAYWRNLLICAVTDFAPITAKNRPSIQTHSATASGKRLCLRLYSCRDNLAQAAHMHWYKVCAVDLSAKS